MLVPVLTVAENIVLGEETMANPIFLDRAEAKPPDRRAGRPVRLRDRPGRQGRLAVGRLAAAGRDPQGALSRGADPRPRRADGRPDAAGDRGDLRRPAPPGRGGPQHHLHQPQAVRGPRDRGPDHRHPARARSSASGLPAETNEEDLAELMVGRGVQLTVDRGESHPGKPALEVSGLRVRDDRGSEVVRGVDLEIRAGEILGIAGVAGNGQDEAGRGAHRAAPGDRRRGPPQRTRRGRPVRRGR